MPKYLWEENIDTYLDGPVKNIPLERQLYLKSLYNKLSEAIKAILAEGLTFSKIEEVIKKEEVLNLILLSFMGDEDIVAASPHGIFYELEDAYISTKTTDEKIYPFDSETLISKI